MKGHEIINHLVRDEMPDMEKVRERCHREGVAPSTGSTIIAKRLMPIAAAFVMLFAVSTTMFAALGGFDWFMQRFNPTFADVSEPVMSYSEEQGIRMTVIGVARFENMAVVYLSLQDITGANRLTASLDFRDGFSISMEESDASISDVNIHGFSTRRNLLYFDEVTNTVYLEIQISADTAISDPLSLGTFLIAFEVVGFEYEPILISLSEIGTADTISIIPHEHIAGMSSAWGLEGIEESNEILLPGRLADMPTNTETHWISNIGVVDGQLRVQLIRTMEEFGASGGFLSLMSPIGEPIYATFATHLWADKSFAPVNLNQYIETYGWRAPYHIDEFVFDVDIDRLADYTLVFTGSVTHGVEGNWQVTAYTADTTNQVIAITNDIWTEGNLYEFITLTPIGIQAMGSFAVYREPTPDVIYVETADGLIQLRGAGGSFSSGSFSSESFSSGHFNVSWQAESPLNTSTVTAIIINDLRISIP